MSNKIVFRDLIFYFYKINYLLMKMIIKKQKKHFQRKKVLTLISGGKGPLQIVPFLLVKMFA